MKHGSLTAPLEPVTEAGQAACAMIAGQHGFLSEQAIANDRSGEFAHASVRLLNDLGVLAACAPAAYGGLGLESLYDLGVLNCRMAACDASVAIAVYMHLTLSEYYARSVRACGVAGHDPRLPGWLRAIGSRAMIVCSTVAEPGRNPWEVTTTAVRHTDGWQVTGTKALASISPAATHFYTRLRAETADGAVQASAMIPRSLPGVSVLDDWDGLGLRGSGSGRVRFEGVMLPQDAISSRGRWGERGPASRYAGRVAAAAPKIGVFLGIAEAAREAAVASLAGGGQTRPKRLDSAGARLLLAELDLRLATARGVLNTALAHAEAVINARSASPVPEDAGHALMRECVAAGMIVERAAADAVDLAMQVYGGGCYVAGHPLGRMLRDLRAGWFMRPYTPAEEWVDFLADSAMAAATSPQP